MWRLVRRFVSVSLLVMGSAALLPGAWIPSPEVVFLSTRNHDNNEIHTQDIAHRRAMQLPHGTSFIAESPAGERFAFRWLLGNSTSDSFAVWRP